MRLKNISVSETNYQVLKNLGRAGESFNDVISELIARGTNCRRSQLNNDVKKLQSERGLEAPAQTGHQPTEVLMNNG